jgi:hypothetical protein
VTFETREPRKSPKADARSIVAANKSYCCYSTDVDDRIQSYRAGTRDDHPIRTHVTGSGSSGTGARLDAEWPLHEDGEIGTIPPDCHSKKLIPDAAESAFRKWH